MTGFPLNPPNAPISGSDGRCTTEWYRFFTAIQKTIGTGVSSPFEDALFYADRPDPRAAVMPDDPALWQAPAIVVRQDADIAPWLGQMIAAVPPAIATRTVRAVSATGDIELSDDILIVDATAGNVTLTLPPAATARGKVFHVKKIDAGANSVILEGDGAETVDDAANVTWAVQYQAYTVACDGAEWWIV